MTTDFKLSNNGHEAEQETQEQLDHAVIELKNMKGPDGALVTLGKQELSLLNKILSSGDEAWREEWIWRMCDFLDEDEAHNHVAAYYEAKDLGMDTSFNVSYAFALCSTNRKGGFKNNLIANITDAVQHGKWANSNNGGNKGKSYANPRSPIGS